MAYNVLFKATTKIKFDMQWDFRLRATFVSFRAAPTGCRLWFNSDVAVEKINSVVPLVSATLPEQAVKRKQTKISGTKNSTNYTTQPHPLEIWDQVKTF